jgi:hypothetical protein
VVEPVSGYMTKYGRYFPTRGEAIRNETEFALRELLEPRVELDALEVIFKLLDEHRSAFMAYLTALGIPNEETPETLRRSDLGHDAGQAEPISTEPASTSSRRTLSRRTA